MKIIAPRIPETLVPADRRQLEEMYAEEADLTRLRLEKTDLQNILLPDAAFSQCVFTGCRLAGAQLPKAEFVDVTFKNCDFSGCQLGGAYFSRCTFTDCKAVGVQLQDANIKQISSEKGRMLEGGVQQLDPHGV